MSKMPPRKRVRLEEKAAAEPEDHPSMEEHDEEEDDEELDRDDEQTMLDKLRYSG